MIPSAAIPINTTNCQGTPPTPTYSNSTLVKPCDIVPLIASLTFPPPGVPRVMCVASAPPNCSTITCSVPGTNDTLKFKIEPCYDPPAMTVDSYVNGSSVFHKTFAHTADFTFTASKVPMRVTLVQHTEMTSLGFKVSTHAINHDHNPVCFLLLPVYSIG